MSALTAGERAKLRAAQHSSEMYLAVLVPDDVWAGTVTNDEDRGATAIEYSASSGTPDNTLAGMIAWFGSSSGQRDVGIARIKAIDTGTTTLTIEENDLDLDAGTHITVKKVWLPRAKLPNIDTSGASVTFTKDGESYTDENENIPPVVNMGPAVAAFLSGGTVDLKFVDEYSWSPVGATLDTVTWGWDGGAEQSGAGTVADPYIVRFSSAGVYWVSCSITDSNSAVSIGYRPVLVYDASTLPYAEFQSGPRRSTMTGTRQEFTVYGDADQNHFPDGAWVVRWNKNYYDNTLYEMDTRYPYRGDIVFVGWLVGESVRTDTNVSSTSFEVVDITAILDKLPGFGQVLSQNPSPTDWHEMPDLDVIKAAYYILKWHSTVLDVCDFDYSLARSSSEILIQEQRWGKNSLFQQLDGGLNRQGIFANLCGDVQSCLHIRQDPCLMDNDDRAATVVKVVDLATTDWSQFQTQRRQRRQAQYVRMSGIAWDGSQATALVARCPGIPEQHPSTVDVGNQVLVDQDDLNRLVADYYAKIDSQYASATLDLPGNWDVFDPSLQERVTLTLTATQNNRELSFDTGDPWIVREVTVNEDAAAGLVRSVSLTLELETEHSLLGIKIGQEVPVAPPPLPTPPPAPIPEPAPTTEGDTGRRIIACEDGVFVCDEIGLTEPSWYAVNTGIALSDRRCWKFIRDPWHWWTTGGDEKTAWAIFGSESDGTNLIGGKLYKMEDFPNGAWVEVLDPHDYGSYASAGICDVRGSIEIEDTFYAVARTPGGSYSGGFAWFKTDDGGETWTHIYINLGAGCKTYGWPHKPIVLTMSDHSGASTVWVSYTSNWLSTLQLMRSFNEGVTWANYNPLSIYGTPYGVVVPYDSPTWTDLTLFLWQTDERIVRTETADGLPPGFSYVLNGASGNGLRSFDVWSSNRDYVAYLMNEGGIWTSITGGDSWSSWKTMTDILDWSALWKWTSTGQVENILLHDSDHNALKLVTATSEYDKTGNLLSVAPNMAYVTTIDRDTLGSA